MNNYLIVFRYTLISALLCVSFIYENHALDDELEQQSSVIMTPSQHTPETLDEDDFVMISRDNKLPIIQDSTF